MHAESEDLSVFERYTEYSPSLKKRINVTHHHFRELKTDKIEVSGSLPSMVKPNYSYSINGRVISEIKDIGLVVDSRNQILET